MYCIAKSLCRSIKLEATQFFTSIYSASADEYSKDNKSKDNKMDVTNTFRTVII